MFCVSRLSTDMVVGFFSGIRDDFLFLCIEIFISVGDIRLLGNFIVKALDMTEVFERFLFRRYLSHNDQPAVEACELPSGRNEVLLFVCKKLL